jgi:hypothetical protein
MPADLHEKTNRYETMLADALDVAAVAVPLSTPLGEAAAGIREMAESYLTDGRYFREHDDPVNALVAFSYGYGWLDAGVRLGLFAVPDNTELFTTEQRP